MYLKTLSLYEEALGLQAQFDLTLVMGLDVAWMPDGLQRDGEHVRATGGQSHSTSHVEEVNSLLKSFTVKTRQGSALHCWPSAKASPISISLLI
jgi:hypothetical protein